MAASFVSAMLRREALGIKNNDTPQHLEAIKAYAAIAKADDRRYMWIVERACTDTSHEMDKLEAELVIAERFGRQGRVNDIQERLKRLEEDFVFLDAALQLIKEQHMKGFAEQFAKGFKKTDLKKR